MKESSAAIKIDSQDTNDKTQAKEKGMIEQKNIHEMTRREYCSYVQRTYGNDPKWVRTRLISKWDQNHEKKQSEGNVQ